MKVSCGFVNLKKFIFFRDELAINRICRVPVGCHRSSLELFYFYADRCAGGVRDRSSDVSRHVNCVSFVIWLINLNEIFNLRSDFVKSQSEVNTRTVCNSSNI